jgi:hypothetical protein
MIGIRAYTPYRMSETLKPTPVIQINTCELSPETCGFVMQYFSIIESQINPNKIHESTYAFLQSGDSKADIARFKNAHHEMTYECGKIGPVERYIERTLADAVRAVENSSSPQTEYLQEIGNFINLGLNALKEINPEHTEAIIQKLESGKGLSSTEIPRS